MPDAKVPKSGTPYDPRSRSVSDSVAQIVPQATDGWWFVIEPSRGAEGARVAFAVT